LPLRWRMGRLPRRVKCGWVVTGEHGARFLCLRFEMDGAAREKCKPFWGVEVFPFYVIYYLGTKKNTPS
jgi:hypothetical protein